jgi:uncharacterized OsmC-like protein
VRTTESACGVLRAAYERRIGQLALVVPLQQVDLRDAQRFTRVHMPRDDVDRKIVPRRGAARGHDAPAAVGDDQVRLRTEAHVRVACLEQVPERATLNPTMETTMNATHETTCNGLDLEQMRNTVAALQSDPSLARLQFRARNQWIDGGENRSTIKEFYGAGAEDTSRSEAFTFTNGEPPVLLGANEGANPVEFLLHALAGCVTTTTVLHAAARGIKLRRLATALVGDLDLQGLLALDDGVPAGYESIRIEMDIEADCSEQELDELIAFAQRHSPVCNTVCRPVPVSVQRVKARRAAA